MRILFFTSDDGKLGGAKSLFELVSGLKEEGNTIIVLNPYHNELNEKLNSAGIKNYSVGYDLNICRANCRGIKLVLKYIIKFFKYIISQKKAIKKIERIIDFSNIDLIHTNNTVEDIGAYFSKKYNLPHIWHLREFGDLDFNFLYFNKNIGRFISDHSNKIIAISESIKRHWIKREIDEKKITVISDGVFNNFVPGKQRNDDIIKFIFAGNIIPEKGQMNFIECIAKLSKKDRDHILIDLYGTCEEKYLKKIKAYLKNNKLEKTVRYMGYLEDMSNVYGNYDVGINNSKSEAMGRVTIEYMMSGLYVLASNCGANPEILKNGQCGSLYEYMNEGSIIRSVRWIMENKQKVREIGNMNLRIADNEYGNGNSIKKIIQIYQSVL